MASVFYRVGVLPYAALGFTHFELDFNLQALGAHSGLRR